MDAFVEMLRTWQNFYFMTGGAAAALLGLMFVALSLGQHLITDERREMFHVFVSPGVAYFVAALLLSCVMLNPVYTPPALALILTVGSLFGLMRTMTTVIKLFQIARRYQDFDFNEWMTQVILPPINFLLILVAALCLVIDQWSLAFNGLWLADILLLVCAVASTWSLVMWIVDQRQETSEER
jgi:hypothetical protein